MHKIIKVIPLDGYLLVAYFENGECRIKDIKTLLYKPVFSPLRNESLFKSVTLVDGAVTWKIEDGTEIDICPDNLYMTSEPYIQ